MNHNATFTTLSDLANAINEKIARLAEGKLSREELETITTETRELYERLIVLRHKAYDREVKGAGDSEVTKEKEKSEEQAQAPVSFRMQIPEVKAEPVAPNQVSLIDVIEEITREEIPAENSVVSEVSSRAAPEHPLPSRESLNDKLSKAIPAQETLARKMENTPISDLKRAITLNQRFQFSRELFKGNNEDYEVTIDRLNTVGRDEALRTLDSLRSRYAWSEDSPVAQDFKDLVERRHQE
jgi:hypothetical protein